MRYAVPAALAAMLVVLASGCGSAENASAAPSSSASASSASPSSALPSSAAASSAAASSASPSSAPSAVATVPSPVRPSAPPNGFTDQNKPDGWIVGTVTAGGTGPCYGLETDEGVQYALYSTAGIRLDRGARIRIKGTPSRLRIYCGPGKLLDLLVAEPIR